MYAILDIETTGGKYNEEGITEIAIYRFDGQEVVDRFISLINPEKEIQPFVVKLTGINAAMLRNAPKFYEVAKRIVEITEDCILVAHNAQFDYRILKTEFRRLGFDYRRKSLCTVELAQKLMPDQPSYSLGKLVRSLGIPVSDRHRANGDAQATLKLFQLLLQKDTEKHIVSHTVKTATTGTLSPRLLDIIEGLPTDTGLFYVHDEQGKVIFIGKGKNVKQKVNQLFISLTKNAIKIQKEVRAVTYEKCGTELLAALKENTEILKLRPRYNPRKKNPSGIISLHLFQDQDGYLQLEMHPYKRERKELFLFPNHVEARAFVDRITGAFELCLKKNQLSEAKKACSAHELGTCHGACIGKEVPETYNQRLMQALDLMLPQQGLGLLLGKGRKIEEDSAIVFEDGELKGYTYYELNYQRLQTDILRQMLSPLSNSVQNRLLICNFLRKHPKTRILQAGSSA